MRRFLTIAVVAAVLVGVWGPRTGAQSRLSPPDTREGKRYVDLKSDIMAPVAPGDTAIYLVGDFAAQHNGAVITSDSAVRYSDLHIEFFGNVLINKNTTYIYGDRAEYDGTVNEARVYSELVKVVDGEATLYTTDFRFNTKDNVGTFAGGGVMTNRDNRLEAVRGYYYADTKELVCVDEVEMRNDEYELTGDSVVYNMETDNAFFFDHTRIWNRDGDYLYADRGAYRKNDSLYLVTRNGYLLTATQEMWSDSIDYHRAVNHVVLRHDLQLDDNERKIIGFGDYGEYWREPGNAFLTRRPAILSYDLSQGPDTLYVRADSMFLFSLYPGERVDSVQRVLLRLAPGDYEAPATDSAALDTLPLPHRGLPGGGGAAPRPGDRQLALREGAERISLGEDAPAGERPAADSLSGQGAPEAADSLALAASALRDSLGRMQPDSLLAAADSLSADSVLSDARRKELLKEEARRVREERREAAAEAKREKLAEIAADRRAKNRARLDAERAREEARERAYLLREASKMAVRQERAARRGRRDIEADSAARWIAERLRRDSLVRDSLARAAEAAARRRDSLPPEADSLTPRPDLPAAAADSLAVCDTVAGDSLYRLARGFRNVRIYRSDFQAVCDSMTGISTDSTLHLYISPVLWNENNQITAEVMDVYTRNQQIERAEMSGDPMMVAQIDTSHYNQISGRQMTVFFREGELFREDVEGNVQTIYYTEDGTPPELTMVSYIESGSATYYIEERQVVRIVYRTDPDHHSYPLDQVPPDRERYLPGFRWEGDRRPSKHDVFDRRVRPSQREKSEQLPRPSFPIMERIEQMKVHLTEQRRWTDRRDEVDPATVEWMHELGYEVGQPRTSGPAL